jgi:pyruvate ferredoxin oxidoreductase alpha subunit
LSEDFRKAFGRDSGGLVKTYRAENAETVVVALGSVNGTIQEVVDEMRAGGHSIGSLSIACFRPFPREALQAALAGARRVVVIEKSLAVGSGGIVSADVQMALAGCRTRIYTVIAGLGGRAITKTSLKRCFEQAIADRPELLTFLDLDMRLIARHLERERLRRRSGPAAENLLHDINLIAAQIG